eukprot:TRINITY_DN5346_c0_g1_i14.p5 TRINITY_DN5346_c0_g1~~TRINITY_DN5346_c0_g1_i14.p5  ORF type:complete len:147 (+),score=29.12 TRINITY_DN5346_c0_g1_i14:324-764(+)
MKNLLSLLVLFLLLTCALSRCDEEGREYGRKEDVYKWTCLKAKQYLLMPIGLEEPEVDRLNMIQKFFYDGCLETLDTSPNVFRCLASIFMPDPAEASATAAAGAGPPNFAEIFSNMAQGTCFDKAINFTLGRGSAIASAAGNGHRH